MREVPLEHESRRMGWLYRIFESELRYSHCVTLSESIGGERESSLIFEHCCYLPTRHLPGKQVIYSYTVANDFDAKFCTDLPSQINFLV